jgi:Cu(I)/Ag(I) efflux system membrane fusion protein
VLTVPRSAVLATGDAPVVYVEASSPGRYVARTVSLGRAGDREWEVIAGLGVGERVVTSGAMLVDAQRQMQAYTSSKADDRLP